MKNDCGESPQYKISKKQLIGVATTLLQRATIPLFE